MKLTWRDFVNLVLAFLGGLVVFAKLNSYSWAVIGSWRNAAAILAIVGLAMFAFSGFNFLNRSILNVAEMELGAVAVVLAIWGMIAINSSVFYTLAAVLAVVWVIDTARHIRHSLIEIDKPTFHHQAHVH